MIWEEWFKELNLFTSEKLSEQINKFSKYAKAKGNNQLSSMSTLNNCIQPGLLSLFPWTRSFKLSQILAGRRTRTNTKRCYWRKLWNSHYCKHKNWSLRCRYTSLCFRPTVSEFQDPHKSQHFYSSYMLLKCMSFSEAWHSLVISKYTVI